MNAYNTPETGELVASVVAIVAAAILVAVWTIDAWRIARRTRKARDLRAQRASRHAALRPVASLPDLRPLRSGIGGLGHRAQAFAEIHPAHAARKLGYSDLLRD